MDFDYIIAGAGAAGCVMAARLSENPNRRVLLIEAGGEDDKLIIRVPGLAFIAGPVTRHNWNFDTEPVPGLNGRKLRFLQGKILGGSSSINGMIYTRGHSAEYDKWSQFDCPGWSFEDVMPFFKKAEDNIRGASRWHGGSGGGMKVRPTRSDLGICDVFLKAASEEGFEIVDDLNADAVDAFGYHDTNVAAGERQSTARSYLRSARARKNLTVWTESHVDRIIFENGRAVGLEVSRGETRQVVHAAEEVILACGAIKSPQILMLSGIGDSAQLAQFGIDTLVHSPNVGKNLQNHPSYRMLYKYSRPDTAARYLNPLHGIGVLARYAFNRSGPLAETPFAIGGFIRSDPSLTEPDIQVVVIGGLLPTSKQQLSMSPITMFPREHGFSVIVYQGTPYSRGKVVLNSSDAQAKPSVYPNYFADERDLDILERAVMRLRLLPLQPSMKGLATEVQPKDVGTDHEKLKEDIRQNIGTSYHQCGTCAMGASSSAVLDTSMRVRGVKGLRVVDASAIPVMPTAAIHAPVIMMAERAADLISRNATVDGSP